MRSLRTNPIIAFCLLIVLPALLAAAFGGCILTPSHHHHGRHCHGSHCFPQAVRHYSETMHPAIASDGTPFLIPQTGLRTLMQPPPAP